MGLNIPNFFSSRGGSSIIRQDIIKFGTDIQFITAPGVPVGNHDEAELYLNIADQTLYASVNYKKGHVPTLLWLKLNGNTQDYSTGNKPTITENGSPSYTNGKYGNGLEFDGTDDDLDINNSLGFNFHEDWTISFWVKAAADIANGEEIRLFSRYKDADEYFYLRSESDGSDLDVRFVYRNTGASVPMIFTQKFSRGAWHHLVLSHDASAETLKLFIDGNEESKDTGGFPEIAFAGTEDYKFGSYQGDYGDNSFILDELKIWDTTREDNSEELIEGLNIDRVNWLAFSGGVPTGAA